MLKNISRPQLIAAWFAVIVVLFALTVVWGAVPTISAGAFWLLACLGPAYEPLAIGVGPLRARE
jgi:hypothetical protein